MKATFIKSLLLGGIVVLLLSSCVSMSPYGQFYEATPGVLKAKRNPNATIEIVEGKASAHRRLKEFTDKGWQVIGTSNFSGEYSDPQVARELAVNNGGDHVIVAYENTGEKGYKQIQVPIAHTPAQTMTVNQNSTGTAYGNAYSNATAYSPYGTVNAYGNSYGSANYYGNTTTTVDIPAQTVYGYKDVAYDVFRQGAIVLRRPATTPE